MKLAGDFPGDFFKEMPIKWVLCYMSVEMTFWWTWGMI